MTFEGFTFPGNSAAVRGGETQPMMECDRCKALVWDCDGHREWCDRVLTTEEYGKLAKLLRASS